MSTVLIIEDHEATRQMLTVALEAAGLKVEAVANGIKLIKIIRETQPDIILLDIMMPWVNGFDLCQTVRENPDICNIPIFMVSAKSAPDDIQRGFDCGANEFIEKPVDLSQLIQKISEYTA